MKLLAWHCTEYKTEVKELSETGVGEIVTDEFRQDELKVQEAAVVFITVQKGDEKVDLSLVVAEIETIADDWQTKNILIVPFAHLANDLAQMATSRTILDEITKRLGQIGKYNAQREHFGSDKELFVHVKGHKASVRYRQF